MHLHRTASRYISRDEVAPAVMAAAKETDINKEFQAALAEATHSVLTDDATLASALGTGGTRTRHTLPRHVLIV